MNGTNRGERNVIKGEIGRRAGWTGESGRRELKPGKLCLFFEEFFVFEIVPFRKPYRLWSIKLFPVFRQGAD